MTAPLDWFHLTERGSSREVRSALRDATTVPLEPDRYGYTLFHRAALRDEGADVVCPAQVALDRRAAEVCVISVLWLGLVGCGSDVPPVSDAYEGAVPLARTRATTSIVLPETSRTTPLPDRVQPMGKFNEHRRGKNWIEWKIWLPFRSVYLGHSASRLPRGFTMESDFERKLQYGTRAAPWTWRVDQHVLYLKLPMGVPPKTEGLTVRYDSAYEIEKHRNPETSDRSESDFVFRTVDIANETVRGVYVPAPGQVAWSVDVPDDAHLEARVHLLTPEVRMKAKSDGATGGARVRGPDGAVLAETSCPLEPGKHCDLDLPLLDFAAHTVTVELYSEPGADIDLDYVFFEDPVVETVLDDPKQVVLLFVDTLRADRLGTYGYERETPAIDAFASESVVFDNARSISPWTLPATRAVLTGRQPEEWDAAQTLAATLSNEGWATTAYVTNAFLSRPFGMGRDWGTYRYQFLNPSKRQVKWSKEVLERHKDRNQLLLVHFMDSHLPYKEPEEYRGMYAGPHPEGLPERFGLLDMHLFSDRPDARDYLSDRYDQTIRFVDDSLKDLFEALDDDAIVLLYSDHGEEFWEHAGIEHGHALWDEVLRVPLIVKAPGLEPGRVAAPVNLLDLAPTLYELLEIEAPPDLDGQSLVPLAKGDTQAVEAFSSRPQVFGRTLRSRDSWGLLDGTEKIVAQDGKVLRYDLATDPDENAPTPLTPEQLSSVRERMSDGLGRPFVPVLRIRGPGKDKMWKVGDATVTLTLDGPVRATWLGHNAPKRKLTKKGSVVTAAARGILPNEIYVLPEAGIADIERVELKIQDGEQVWTGVWPADKTDDAWLRVGPEGAQAELAVELTPLPAEVEVPTSNAEMEEELKILGYIEE